MEQNCSHKEKQDTSKKPLMLTPSEIESLRQEGKEAFELFDKLIEQYPLFATIDQNSTALSK